MYHWESEWDKCFHRRHPNSLPFHRISVHWVCSVHSCTGSVQDGRSSTHSPAHLSCPHSHSLGRRPIERECIADRCIETRSLCTPGEHSLPHLSYLHSRRTYHISSEEGCTGDFYSGSPRKDRMSVPHSLAHRCCPCSRRHRCTQPTVGYSGSLFYN